MPQQHFYFPYLPISLPFLLQRYVIDPEDRRQRDVIRTTELNPYRLTGKAVEIKRSSQHVSSGRTRVLITERCQSREQHTGCAPHFNEEPIKDCGARSLVRRNVQPEGQVGTVALYRDRLEERATRAVDTANDHVSNRSVWESASTADGLTRECPRGSTRLEPRIHDLISTTSGSSRLRYGERQTGDSHRPGAGSRPRIVRHRIIDCPIAAAAASGSDRDERVVANSSPIASRSRSDRHTSRSTRRRKTRARRTDRESTGPATLCRQIIGGDVSRTVVADCRNTHSVTRKNSPNRTAIHTAIEILICLQNAIASVQERRTSRSELHSIKHDPIANGGA